MTTILTAVEAAARVKRDAAADKVPVVTDGEITALLLEPEYNLYTTWTASTAYKVGAMVRPTTASAAYDYEYVYKAVRGGTSGATEPEFPLTANGTIDDGTGDTAISWQRVTYAPRYNYDLARAVYKVLEIRLARASELSDTSEDGQGFSDNQITQNIERLMLRKRPVGVA